MSMRLLIAVAGMATVVMNWIHPALADRVATSASAPEIYPLSKVRRGQKGYGETTFAGTTPSRFEFEVIGVNKNFIPKMDLILVKSEDPKMRVSGFWQGMSGSPLYIEGKVACAFSYGYRFNKLAIGACTPIHYMKQEGYRKPRSVPIPRDGKLLISPRTRGTMAEWLQVAPKKTIDSAMTSLGATRQPWLARAPMPKVPKGLSASNQGLTPAAIPLALAGFSNDAFREAERLMAPYAITPMRAGGTGNANTGPRRFRMGAPMGIQLIRGDMAGTATCTVSYVEVNRVLACGHPLFHSGELYAPITTSKVHTVIPSAMSAFVIAAPLREVGALLHDRASTVMGDTRLRTAMIPVDIYVDATRAGGKKQEFHVEVINHKQLATIYSRVAARNAMSTYVPDQDHTTVFMESTVEIKGHKPLHFVDHLHSSRGAGDIVGGSRGLRVLAPLMMNPFSPVQLERVTVRMKVTYDTNFGDIDAVRVPSSTLSPGTRSHVYVTLSTYDGKTVVEKVPFQVPQSLAGSIVRLSVMAGDSAGVDLAPPENINDLLSGFRRLLPGNVWAVVLSSADEGVAVQGKLVRDLPPSAIDRFKVNTATQTSSAFKAVSRSTSASKRVLNGKKSLLVRVADD